MHLFLVKGPLIAMCPRCATVDPTQIAMVLTAIRNCLVGKRSAPITPRIAPESAYIHDDIPINVQPIPVKNMNKEDWRHNVYYVHQFQ